MNKPLIGAAVVAAALLGATAAQASCKQGFCMDGYYSGNQRWVDFTVNMSGYTHFNVFNGREQIELGRNERSFRVYKVRGSSPASYRYQIQACNKGSVFSGSQCGAWVPFKHND